MRLVKTILKEIVLDSNTLADSLLFFKQNGFLKLPSAEVYSEVKEALICERYDELNFDFKDGFYFIYI